MESLEIGDDVVLNETNIDKISKLQQNHGGWNSQMMELLYGPSTLLDLSETKGTVEAPSGEVYDINRKLLTKYKKFKLGTTVQIIQNRTLFKKFMEYEGKIPKDVKEILGKKVEIIQIFVDEDYGIKYKNKIFVINKKCISKFGNKEENSEHSSDVVLNENVAALYIAIYTGNIARVSTLINIFGPNIKFMETYPIIAASRKGPLHIIKYLLEKKAKVNVKDEDGDTALHCAVTRSDFEICSLLVEHGADVNSFNNQKVTPIMIATIVGNVHILKLLAGRKEADLTIGNANDDTALHLAIKSSQIECVETLLDLGVCPKTASKTQYIPFHVAAMLEDEKILKLFLKRYGASIINIQDEGRRAAVHFAVSYNRIQCLKLLIEYKADINVQHFMLQTPLHIAVLSKNLNCVKILVENKAELDLKDAGGYTPLNLGMNGKFWDLMNTFRSETLIKGSDKYEDIVLYLAKAGARLDIRNEDGTSPVDECEDNSLKRKLLAIRDERKSGKVSEISAIKPIKVAVTKSVAEELKELRQTVKQMRDEETCKMCNERRRSTVFGCGHTACDICANDLLECRLCNFKFGLQIRIID